MTALYPDAFPLPEENGKAHVLKQRPPPFEPASRRWYGDGRMRAVGGYRAAFAKPERPRSEYSGVPGLDVRLRSTAFVRLAIFGASRAVKRSINRTIRLSRFLWCSQARWKC